MQILHLYICHMLNAPELKALLMAYFSLRLLGRFKDFDTLDHLFKRAKSIPCFAEVSYVFNEATYHNLFNLLEMIFCWGKIQIGQKCLTMFYNLIRNGNTAKSTFLKVRM